MIEPRLAAARGAADFGWLRSYHSFSFGDYYAPEHMGFGALRVINEDFIAPGKGFATHAHRDMEIITYVLQGELTHQDSMGNISVIRAGEVQRMSAGRGVEHSEVNRHANEATHLLQIWITPNVLGIDPSYEEKNFSAAQKRGQLCLLASEKGNEQALRIHQDAKVYAGLFDGVELARLPLSQQRRMAYVHVAQGQIKVNGASLCAGDGLKLKEVDHIVLTEGQDAEVLLFDLAAAP